MKQTLQLKLSQQLTLTPQLQQSIRLLQLSTLELNQELEKFLMENPLLERDESAEAEPRGRAAQRRRTREERAASDAERPGEATARRDDSGRYRLVCRARSRRGAARRRRRVGLSAARGRARPRCANT